MTDKAEVAKNAAITIAKETQALIENKISGENTEIQKKLGELVELIKGRASDYMKDAGEMSKEAYVQALHKAKQSLSETSDFLSEQEKALDKSIAKLEGNDKSHWEKLKKFGDRLDKSVHAAWSVLTESEEKESEAKKKK